MITQLLGTSKKVLSNQSHPHENLLSILKKHKTLPYQRPYTQNKQISALIDKLKSNPNLRLVLDSGCGTGASSYNLANIYPNHVIIGIDKSGHRLNKEKNLHNRKTNNVILINAYCEDVWLLLAHENIYCDHHYLLYPNPWPKKKHIMRRWHAHPIFPTLLNISKYITMRTNWDIYAEEFKSSLEFYNQKPSVSEIKSPQATSSPFETKYIASKHRIIQIDSLIAP
jgi:tRNA (guanine-N7-)-methyltransferase